MSTPLPSQTPNVIVQNPTVRKWAGNILAVAALVLWVTLLVDGAISAFDIQSVTGPAAVIISGLLSIFQLSVTSPNVPTKS